MIARRMTRAALTALSALAAGLAGCSDSHPSDPSGKAPAETPPITGFIVSDLIPLSTVAGALGGAATRSLGSSLAVNASASAAEQEEVVYISLAEGTAPDGRTAAIRRVGESVSAITSIIDGGFDPVPVLAKATDSVEVVVTDANGKDILSKIMAIRPGRPPVVVRTYPPKKRTDIAINASIVIVFSEPMNPTSLNTSSVQVLRGAAPVAGQVRPLTEAVGSVAFTPDESLAPNTSYSIVVKQGVTDLGGQALDADVVVAFTTGQSRTGPVSAIEVRPDTVYMSGSQYQLSAIAVDQAGNVLVDQPVSWRVVAPNGALSVSSSGLLTATTEGTYGVVASVGGVEGYAMVVVKFASQPVSMQVLSPRTTVPAGD